MKSAAPQRDILPVTLGTAGHIDHGKTTLLRALAGGDFDTDRLAEERDRGLTIDVGYAELELPGGVEVGVVDVPGHEKFVRNMVAGATGIDVVMLVVAADDGVMPQTREHLDIMSLLGLRSGVVAITKTDTVDAELVELVQSEVEDLLQDTFLADATMVPVSGITGDGIDALRTEIARLVQDVPAKDADGFFRMPVLRVFTSQGFGTIVTGIPVSGRVEVGERIEVEPGARRGRVRGLQVYHRAASEASAGHRTAINIAELEHRKVGRGDVVCTPGVFEGTALLDVKLSLLPGVSRPLRHNQEVRLHVGTVECAARPLLVGAKTLEPGGTCWAQMKLDRQVVIAPGDRFIIRLPAQLITLGGGNVLGPGRHGRRRKSAALAAQFEERERGLADLRVAVESSVRRAGLDGTDRKRLTAELKRRKEELEPELAALAEAGSVVELDRGLLVHGEEASRGEDAVAGAVGRFHETNPLVVGMRKAMLSDKVHGAPAVVDGLIDRLGKCGRIELLPAGRIRATGWEPTLSTAQQQRCDKILEALGREPFGTPRAQELPTLVSGLPAEVDKLLGVLEGRGELVRLKDGVLFLCSTIEQAKETVRGHFGAADALMPADLKRLLGVTRKYGIPLLEHFDAVGFTRRSGDKRILR
jgi:selenocysteine-specific elongation factor